MTFGFLLLPVRPVIAGVLIGLLAYKPHLGMLIPLALLAGGYWRAIVAATVTVLASVAATVTLFGSKTWESFLTSLAPTRRIVIEEGRAFEGAIVSWERIMSVFAAVRRIGGTVESAYVLQAIVALFAVGVVITLFRGNGDRRVAIAAVLVGSLLTTPYFLHYDMAVIGPAIALLVAHGLERGFLPYEKSVLAFGWIAPLIAQPAAEFLLLPVGTLSVLLLQWIIAARTWPALILGRGLDDSMPPLTTHGVERA